MFVLYEKKILPRPILLLVLWTAGGATWFSASVAKQRPSPSWRESKTFTVEGSTGYRRPTLPPNSQYANVHHSFCPVSPAIHKYYFKLLSLLSLS